MALAVALQEPARSQDTATAEPAYDGSEAHLANLLGRWIRNEELSDDPVLNTTAAAREREFRSPMMDELARDHADRLDSVHIGVADETLLLLDCLGETRNFPLDGRFKGLDIESSGRALLWDETLSLETMATPDATLQREQVRRQLRRISRQTGGRHFHIDLLTHEVPWTVRIERAFDEIEDDLRNQYVLTYYSDQPPGVPVKPEIRLTRRGFSLRSAVPLEAIQ